MSTDLIGGIVAFLLTLMVFSYLIGDNPLFRIAVFIFVGVSAGYAASVAWWQVLLPDLLIPLLKGPVMQQAILVVPLILSGLLILKVSPRLTRLGTPSMAFLVGVSAAVALGGAVTGTLLPQTLATVNAFDVHAAGSPVEAILNGSLFNAGFILVGMLASIAYFQFGARTAADGTVRRFALVELVAFIGGVFLAITLGVLFAGVYSAALTAFIERFHFFGSFLGIG
jgi:hypothetical protein